MTEIKHQPNKNTNIPVSATHWNWALVHSFFRLDNNSFCQYVDNQWIQISDAKDQKYLSKGMVALQAIEYSTPLERVNTIYGEGVVVGKNRYRGRTIVDLDNNPFSYRPVFFYGEEILSQCS